MKLVMVWVLLLSSSVAMSQQAKPAKASTVTLPAMAPVNTSVAESGSKTLAVLKDRFQARYFSEILGPSVKKWDDNQVDGDAKNLNYRSTDPTNWFHQISLRWRLKDQIRLAVEPRFTTQFGDRNELSKDSDRQVIVQEDHRLRLVLPYWENKEKWINTTLSIGNRFATSEASQDANIVTQPEILHITNFQLTPALGLSLWNQLRYYWYEQKVDKERYRLYTGPSVTYTIDDIYSIFVMYEHEMQHNEPEGKRKYGYLKQTLQDIYAGVNINVTPSITVYPFVRFAQLRRWDWSEQRESMQLGAWVMGNIF